MMFNNGELTLLLCMVWGLPGPRCQGEVCSHWIPDCSGWQWCPRANPAPCGTSALGLRPLGHPRTCSVPARPFPCAAPRLLLDRSNSARSALSLLQTALVSYPGEGAEGDFMGWPSGSSVAQLKYRNIDGSAG